MLYIAEQMYQTGRQIRKLCIIDEAWKLLKGDNQAAQAFIEGGYRTSRKHEGAFVMIAQSLMDFQMSQEATVAWENSAYKFILSQGSGALEAFVKQKPNFLNAYEQQLVSGFVKAETAKFSEFLLCAGDCRTAHRLFVDPISRILYSSKGPEVEAVKAYQAAGMSLFAALKQVATDRFPDEMATLFGRESPLAAGGAS